MKTARILSRLYSVVAILAVLFYLTSVAMADLKHKAPPEVDDSGSFSDSGTPTETPLPRGHGSFSHPLPPFTPPGQLKKDDDEGEDGDVEQLAVPAPDLIVVEFKVSLNNGTFGDSFVPNQSGTMEVTIKNQGDTSTGTGFYLATWIHAQFSMQPKVIFL